MCCGSSSHFKVYRGKILSLIFLSFSCLSEWLKLLEHDNKSFLLSANFHQLKHTEKHSLQSSHHVHVWNLPLNYPLHACCLHMANNTYSVSERQEKMESVWMCVQSFKRVFGSRNEWVKADLSKIMWGRP